MKTTKLYIGILLLGIIWLFSDAQKVYALFSERTLVRNYLVLESELLERQRDEKTKVIDNILALKNEDERKYYAKYAALKNESVDSIWTIADKYTKALEGNFGFDKCNAMRNYYKHKLKSAETLSIIADFENRLNYYYLTHYSTAVICGYASGWGPWKELQKDFLNDSVYYFIPISNTNNSKLTVEINGRTFNDSFYYDYLTIKKEKEIVIKYTILILEDERTRIDTIFKYRRFKLDL